jgi:hypothetical protein
VENAEALPGAAIRWLDLRKSGHDGAMEFLAIRQIPAQRPAPGIKKQAGEIHE